MVKKKRRGRWITFYRGDAKGLHELLDRIRIAIDKGTCSDQSGQPFRLLAKRWKPCK